MVVIREVPAKVVWPVRHTVMYPEKTFESIKLADDLSGIHLALYDDQELVSVVSLFIKGNELQFRKFATIEKYQRKGYGSRLVEYVIDWASQHGINRIWCNARKSASSFYQKFGFYETATVFLQDNIDFVVMEKLFPA